MSCIWSTHLPADMLAYFHSISGIVSLFNGFIFDSLYCQICLHLFEVSAGTLRRTCSRNASQGISDFVGVWQ